LNWQRWSDVKMKTKIIVSIALSLTIILAAVIVSNYLIQTQPDPPKNQDMQITGIDFCSNGIDIIVYFENKGLKSFTFKPDMSCLASHLEARTVRWSSFPNEVVTIAPQEKLNVTCEVCWRPDAKYEFHVDGVYEGTDYRIRIKHETRSPSTYPYYLEITGSVFSPGIKTYDELGALKNVGNSELTLLVVNHHDTLTFTICERHMDDGVSSGGTSYDISIAPKQTKTISMSLRRTTITRLYLKAKYEVETNSTRYPFATGKHTLFTYSNYYTYQSTN